MCRRTDFNSGMIITIIPLFWLDQLSSPHTRTWELILAQDITKLRGLKSFKIYFIDIDLTYSYAF
jgi:hypothetical protein